MKKAKAGDKIKTISGKTVTVPEPDYEVGDYVYSTSKGANVQIVSRYFELGINDTPTWIYNVPGSNGTKRHLRPFRADMPTEHYEKVTEGVWKYTHTEPPVNDQQIA